MVFSSVHFLLFFLIVCCLYWVLHLWPAVQNALLAAAGIYFYWTWDWRLLGLLALVYSSTFSLAILVERNRMAGKDKAARACFIASLAVILGVLLTFKYSNFFIMSFCEMFGLDSGRLMIRLLVPMGISFYSFMAIGYVMDVYRGKTGASRKPLDFFLFLCFMPLIAAGPIERADRLLPQFASRRTFSYEDGVDGFMLCCHGLFKKVVVADRLKWYVDSVFMHGDYQNSASVLIAMVFYTLQIYCDFSAYSDIARGCARLLGFEIMENFNYPYVSTSIKDFWKRWHISLSTWFRDYVYFPLGGSRVSAARWARNIMIVFLLSGFWHGASWTFVAWGGMHGAWMLIEHGFKFCAEKMNVAKFMGGRIGRSLAWLCTMCIVTIAWLFFRASSISEATGLLKVLFRGQMPGTLVRLCAGMGPFFMVVSMLAIVLAMASDYLMSRCGRLARRTWQPMALSVFWLLCIIFLGVNSDARFIYVQF